MSWRARGAESAWVGSIGSVDFLPMNCECAGLATTIGSFAAAAVSRMNVKKPESDETRRFRVFGA
jgi:hypothetical protein